MIKYILEGLYKTRKGENFKITTEAGLDYPLDRVVGGAMEGGRIQYNANVSDMLRAIWGMYQPTQGQILLMEEVRINNKTLDKLELPPTVNGCFDLTIEQIKILTKIIDWTIPRLQTGWQREADDIIAILEDALDKPPSADGTNDDDDDNEYEDDKDSGELPTPISDKVNTTSENA